MGKKNRVELYYPCVCYGECSPSIEGLGKCIMRTREEGTYCTHCQAASLNRLKRRLRA